VSVLGDKHGVEAALFGRFGQGFRRDPFISDERRDAEFHVFIEPYREDRADTRFLVGFKSANLCASAYVLCLPGAERDLTRLTEFYRLSCANLQWVRKDLSLEDLQTAIGTFIAERDWEQFHSPKNLAMALSVEVAEIVEHFQWLTEGQSRNLFPEKLAEVREEIGDVMIYLLELANKLGIDPVEAAKAKLEINKQKYPVDLVKGKASKYTEY
jgi:dCTP diphosphatase